MTRIETLLKRMRVAGPKILDLELYYEAEAPSFEPGCHEAEIEEIEGAWPFPPDYREFLLRCRRVDAGDIFNGYFLFSPIGVATTSAPRRLFVGSEPHLEEVRVSPIGGDAGGNMFLMGRSPNALGLIWKWNHEFPPRFDGVAREGLLLVAQSFEEFLARVADDWEHFVAGDREWEYLSG